MTGSTAIVIRGGRVLDIRKRSAEPADVPSRYCVGLARRGCHVKRLVE